MCESLEKGTSLIGEKDPNTLLENDLKENDQFDKKLPREEQDQVESESNTIPVHKPMKTGMDISTINN